MIRVSKAKLCIPVISLQHLWVPLERREQAVAERSRQPGTQHGPPADRTCNIAREAQILPSSSRFGWESHAVLYRLLSVLRLAGVPLLHTEKACRVQCCATDRSTKHQSPGCLRVWVLSDLPETFFQVVSHAREMQSKFSRSIQLAALDVYYLLRKECRDWPNHVSQQLCRKGMEHCQCHPVWWDVPYKALTLH